jgi:hypothetical protein
MGNARVMVWDNVNHYVNKMYFIVVPFFTYRERRRHMKLFQRLGIPGPPPNILLGNQLDIAGVSNPGNIIIRMKRSRKETKEKALV